MNSGLDAGFIAGVVVIPLREIADARGAVLHMIRCDAAGFTHFGECYFSEVRPFAVKAWKRHSRQTQNIAVPIGKARFVLYDDRPASVTQGRVQVLDLGRPDAYLRLTIPPGIWYGFTCIGGTPALVANCSDMPHDPAEGESRDLDDKRLPYRWEGPT